MAARHSWNTCRVLTSNAIRDAAARAGAGETKALSLANCGKKPKPKQASNVQVLPHCLNASSENEW